MSHEVPEALPGEVVVAIAGGHVSYSVAGPDSAGALVDAGKIRVLGVTSAGRYKGWPNVPTMTEVGFPSVDMVFWVGLSGPPGLPANIVKILDYGEENGLPFLVMEYLPGGTLKQKSGQKMPWREAVKLILPIAKALAYAHEQQIVHRDVKPANILLTQSGDPMLSDFGIAKILETEETTDLTGTGIGIGTPDYMAPEQATNESVDHRANLYALGIMLYELVTGRKPYQADTPMAVLLKKVNGPLPRPRTFVQKP